VIYIRIEGFTSCEKKDKLLVFFWNSATFLFLLTATYHFV